MAVPCGFGPKGRKMAGLVGRLQQGEAGFRVKPAALAAVSPSNSKSSPAVAATTVAVAEFALRCPVGHSRANVSTAARSAMGKSAAWRCTEK